MAVRRAKGKKSVAISDRSGFKVPYTSLKTTWDGLRVEPEEYEPKHPQLTPARNVVDATALFDPRPDNDPENVEIKYGFTFDPFADRSSRPPVGIPAFGRAGHAIVGLDSSPSVTGLAGTTALGAFSLFISLDAAVTGVAGTGAIGSLHAIEFVNYAITVANPGSGNRYYVDSVLQQQLYLQEGKTYRFDQSDSSNAGHPLRFSTTSNGSHGGGSEYTTGVTTVGTPGSAGAYTQIVVAGSAPTLYYYCTNHSGMGGTAYTPAAGTISLAITVANPGSGNKYYIDTGGPAPTISLTEGTTYRFDQSDGTNSGHPLRFSTTSGGSHSGGSEYTTGVTTNGTPGSAGAYTEITVASSAPTLYYYCTNHSGMGGQLNTPAVTQAGMNIEMSAQPSSAIGTGATGSETGEVNTPTNAGVEATGNIGTESVEISRFAIASSVAATGAVEGFGVSGNGNIVLTVTGISGIASVGNVGTEEAVAEAVETGLAGTGAIGSFSVEASFAWGEGAYGEGTWGR